ncbi:hypothetical protein [Kutzneria sp. NPDC051319]|uniref:VMAP-C domain-containing protein n=1 Tax=Kutzneria sp. NPDC051319 TaxID=3155047 RepID=UPI0034312A5C
MGDQEHEGPISFEHVVDALQEVQFLHHQEGRALLLDLLRTMLGPSFDPAQHPQARLHLYSIVMACGGWEDGLRKLADAVRQLEPGLPAVKKLVNLVDAMSPRELLLTAEHNQLVALLEGWPVTALDDLYREVLGPDADIRPRGHGTARDVVSRLEQHNVRADGIPPVLVFVQRLAALCDEAQAGRLLDWISRQAPRMELTAPVIEAPVLALPGGSDGSGSLYLVMQIERDRLDVDQYVLSHWRHSGGEAWRPIRGTDRFGTLDQIERHVAELVEQAEAEWHLRPELIQLEFVLPRDLMHLPVDQWLTADDGVDRRLGVEFDVVLRSLERMRDLSWHRNWWGRWHRMPAGAPAHWCRRDSDRHVSELTATLADQKEICVVVLDHCVERTSEAGQDPLTVALRAGVPVVLWCREEAALKHFLEVADALVAAGPGGLRATTRKQRNEAQRTGLSEHCGAHVCLLWDDPERMIGLDERPAAPRPEVAT